MNRIAPLSKEDRAQQEPVQSEFVPAIRRALDESTTGLPESTLNRLSQARQLALQRKKPDALPQRAAVPAFAAALHKTPGRRHTPRMLLLWPAVALIAAIVGFTHFTHWQNQHQITETADIDAAILSSDLPLNAYLDHGFTEYLSQQH